MGRLSINQREIVLLYRGQRCGTDKRIIFGPLGGWGVPPRPGTIGYVNWEGGRATVRLNDEGAICLEKTEPVVRGLPPLRLTEW
jgi:hypothetical protein